MGDFDDLPVTAPTADGVERRHALVVGVGKYLEPPQLPFCADDAVRIAALLRAHDYHVELLHDGDGGAATVTVADVEEALGRIVDAADADDLVVAYFSGHGQVVDGRPHLLMGDTRGERIADEGLPLQRILTRLRARPRWVAVFLDVCHMGIAVDPGVGASADHGAARDGGFALLSGSTVDGVTQDTFDEGIFTKALRTGLAGAAAGPDGSVRFSALARHVQAGVADWRQSGEARTMGSRQTPVFRLEVADLVLLPPPAARDLVPAHPRAILSAAFAPSGLSLATGAADGVVRLWDVTGGTLARSVETGQPEVNTLAFSPDGHFISAVCWTYDGAVVMPQTPEPCPMPPPVVGQVTCMIAWAPSGRTRALATTGGLYLQALDRSTDRLSDEYTTAVAFGADDGLWSGNSNGEVRAWGVGHANDLIGGLKTGVCALAESANREFVAAAGNDGGGHGAKTWGDARIWRTDGGGEVATLDHPKGVTGLAYSRGGLLATSCHDGIARIFDGATGQLLRELVRSRVGALRPSEALCVAWSPAGTTLFVGYDDGVGRLYHVASLPTAAGLPADGSAAAVTSRDAHVGAPQLPKRRGRRFRPARRST